ncbi:AMIN-like domain-containing (lipo)protein [Brachybacterium phenoliresistens]|uniref:AMIN-like domain-containing (lipo)protein n=1 Tax=Brachybacterium phenoliresistens TaxID=396014 RepID=UPI0031D63E4D
MKRIISLLASLFLLGALGLVAPVAAQAAPYCGITWGSLAKTRSGFAYDTHLTNLRAGQHTCYDRLVIDLDGDVTGYSIRYVTAVHAPGSGTAVPLAGAADLQIIVHAPAYDDGGRATYSPANPTKAVSVDGYRTFRQVALAGSFEGETTVGLGVRARLPMRAFVLDGPGGGSRIVVDVAHQW